MKSENLKLLLAEDDRDDRMFFKNAFKELTIDNTLTICEDGITLLDYLTATKNLPDILFLDLNMPGKNGMECLKELRDNNRYSNMSIAIYTSSSSFAIQEECLMSGANIFIKKPDEQNKLKKILLEVIYINWQYITDGLNKQNFILSY